MKKIIEPLKLSKIQKEILMNEALSRDGFYKVANDDIDYADMKEIMLMDYLTKKATMIRMRIKKLEDIIEKFNEDVETAKSINIHQDLSGSPLKQIRMFVEYDSRW